jgi:hypothetical protein
MELESHCIICLLYSYETAFEQRAFIEALLAEVSKNPDGLVALCSDCYYAVTGIPAQN